MRKKIIEEYIAQISKIESEIQTLTEKNNDLLKSYDDYIEVISKINNKITYTTNKEETMLDNYKMKLATATIEFDKLLSELVHNKERLASTKAEYDSLKDLKKLCAKRVKLISIMDAMAINNEKEEAPLEYIENYDGQKISILKTEVPEYQEYMLELEKIDATIEERLKNFAKSNTESEVDSFADYLVNSSYLSTELSGLNLDTLQQERAQIISDMTSIENMPGKKSLFNVKVNDKQIKKQISSKYINKYKGLYNRLVSIDLEIASLNDFTTQITFDEELYNNMTDLQKLAYAANLELQIENSEHNSLVYIDKHTNKKIPMQYKSLYERLLRITNQKKTPNYLESPLSKEYLSKRTLHDQKDYYKSLALEIIKAPKTNPVVYSYKDIFVTIDKSLEPLFKETIENYDLIATKAKEELANANIKIEDITSLIPKEPITVTAKNKSVTIDKSNVATLSELESSASNLEELMTDDLSCAIPIIYPDNLDITIDEEYIKTLNKEEEKAYYKLKLHDIELHSKNAAKVLEIALEQTYRYDEIYSGLFHEIVRRYNNIIKDEEKPLTVTEKRRPKFLDKIKKGLKKKSIQITLGAVALLGVLAANRKNDFNLDKNAYETPTVTNIESLSNVTDNAPTKEDEKILDIVNKNLETDDTKVEEDVLGQTFRLNNGASIYSRYYSSTAETPLYKNDLYTTIGVLLETNYGEEIRVDYNTPDCEEIIYNVLEQGGKIIKRQAVCASGLQDFLNTGIPTGIVDENQINLVNENSELKNMIISSLNNGRSR